MNSNTTFVVTGKVRLSFVHLFIPRASQSGGDAKYSTTMLLPKTDIVTKQKIDEAIEAAIQMGIALKWSGIRPNQPKSPIWDGDGLRHTGEAFLPECRGNWVLNASSKQPPQIVDVALNPIIHQSQMYSGVYARVSISFFPYSNNTTKGIGCGLGNVQKLSDGEPLGGRTHPADDFGFEIDPITGKIVI